MLILVTGGARSGKSAYAEKLAIGSGKAVTYLATSQVLDQEMADRVNKHRVRRPAHWNTWEEPYQVAEFLQGFRDKNGLILMDCLTLLISNWLLRELEGVSVEDDQVKEGVEERVGAYLTKVVEAARSCRGDVIMVTNEVGWGLVPPYPLGRVYRDLVGRVNQYAATLADQVYLVVAGISIELKKIERAGL